MKFFYKICLAAFLVTFSSCRAETTSEKIEIDSVRKAVFTGEFYAGDSATLSAQIKIFLDNALPGKTEDASAIIVPHAGYIFSGQIDADAYSRVRDNKYDLVVILGTNHTTAEFSGISVYPKGKFSCPLGTLEIDSRIAADLLREDKEAGTDLTVHEKEHSIEVQIPFIKYLFPEAKIIPVIIGDADISLCTRFAKALSKVVKDKKVLVVASSDLSHYPSFDNAVKLDNTTLNTIALLDPGNIRSGMNDQLEKNIPGVLTCACGEAPIIAAVCYANEIGAVNASVISYSNSGYNPAGSTEKVVGYGAVIISRNAIAGATGGTDKLIEDDSYVLTSSDKEWLLKYARETLSEYFNAQIVPLPRNMNEMLKVKRGAFVTLKKYGELRGCIGHMSEDTPVSTMVGSMALQAALNDNRFEPVKKDELKELEIEISVLTPITMINDADEIVLGRDGVIVKKGYRQAVFLPQVAIETGWSKEMFLDQLCYKAGLSAGDWKDAELYTFRADVFRESDFINR